MVAHPGLEVEAVTEDAVFARLLAAWRTAKQHSVSASERVRELDQKLHEDWRDIRGRYVVVRHTYASPEVREALRFPANVRLTPIPEGSAFVIVAEEDAKALLGVAGDLRTNWIRGVVEIFLTGFTGTTVKLELEASSTLGLVEEVVPVVRLAEPRDFAENFVELQAAGHQAEQAEVAAEQTYDALCRHFARYRGQLVRIRYRPGTNERPRNLVAVVTAFDKGAVKLKAVGDSTRGDEVNVTLIERVFEITRARPRRA